MMASILARGNRDGRSLILKGVDPETCMIVFKNHWAQVVKILEKHDPLRSGRGRLGSTGAGSGLHFGPIPGDEASAVQNYVEHMLFLLMEEGCGQAGAMGPILEFVVMENVMEKLFLWSLRREFTDDMKLEQLRMYEMLVGQSRQPLLHHKPVLRPLMMLLSSCSGANAPAVEAELVLLLNQLCSILAKDPSVLELFFHTSEDQGAANFLIFSLLIPFIHREGVVGRQARDALLYIMALSAENHVVAEHIVENTYFCPVLATGLSGLYSSLPTKLEVPGEDWYCLEREDWLLVPALVQFLHSLEFCNAVIQVAHPSIRSQLVSYIYNGFLVPVLAPALHKLTLEEVMTTTAYLDLFLRSVSEPALLQIFLSFVLLHQHENVYILDTLVSRINTPFQLGTVSLALFRTLIGLYCEDVMLQLVLRYLLPCTHMMSSQRRVLRERDCYSVSAARLLALTPTCCRSLLSPLHAQPPDCFLCSEGTDGSHAENTDEVHSGYTCIMGPEVFLDISYVHYLHDAHSGISSCIKACRVWSAPYDGNNPPSEHYQLWALEEVGRPTTLTQAKRTLRTTHPPDSGPRENRVNLLELEWDDSYDAVPSPGDCDGDVFEEKGPPTPAEPPKHIQEMRKNAIMLIKGSYIEESDFQDDVMVYDLVAEKDAQDHSLTDPLQTEPAAPGLGLDSDQNPEEAAQPLSNGVSFTQQQRGKRHSCGLLLANPSPPGDDLLSEYEELIRSLGVESGSPVKPEKDLRNPLGPAEEEDVMDFTSFAGAPESENTPSPFGPKPRSGCRSQGAPFTGPFISVLLSRLENMLENSLHVNLLLTGILAQLATYPQPLLCSFLLNTNMVFQPNVRSLYQVLASVRNQIEQRAAARSDFPELLKEAQWYLLAREYALRTQDSHSEKNGDWLPNGEEKRTQTIVKGLPPHPKIPPQARDYMFATVLFTEFLKELAAVAQEHSILSHLPMEE